MNRKYALMLAILLCGTTLFAGNFLGVRRKTGQGGGSQGLAGPAGAAGVGGGLNVQVAVGGAFTPVSSGTILSPVGGPLVGVSGSTFTISFSTVAMTASSQTFTGSNQFTSSNTFVSTANFRSLLLASGAVNANMLVGVYPQLNFPVNDQGAGAIYLDNTNNSGVGLNIFSNQGSAAGLGALLRIHANNTSFDQPALHIIQDGTSGAAASIRVDGVTPQIEWVESDQVAPAGKYEDGVNGDIRYIAGRLNGDGSFSIFARFVRPDATGGGYMGLLSTTPIRLYDSDNSNYIALKGSNTIASNFQLVLPAADGTSGQAMLTDGSGNLYFGAVASGGGASGGVLSIFTNNNANSGVAPSTLTIQEINGLSVRFGPSSATLSIAATAQMNINMLTVATEVRATSFTGVGNFAPVFGSTYSNLNFQATSGADYEMVIGESSTSVEGLLASGNILASSAVFANVTSSGTGNFGELQAWTTDAYNLRGEIVQVRTSSSVTSTPTLSNFQNVVFEPALSTGSQEMICRIFIRDTDPTRDPILSYAEVLSTGSNPNPIAFSMSIATFNVSAANLTTSFTDLPWTSTVTVVVSTPGSNTPEHNMTTAIPLTGWKTTIGSGWVNLYIRFINVNGLAQDSQRSILTAWMDKRRRS